MEMTQLSEHLGDRCYNDSTLDCVKIRNGQGPLGTAHCDKILSNAWWIRFWITGQFTFRIPHALIVRAVRWFSSASKINVENNYKLMINWVCVASDLRQLMADRSDVAEAVPRACPETERRNRSNYYFLYLLHYFASAGGTKTNFFSVYNLTLRKFNVRYK